MLQFQKNGTSLDKFIDAQQYGYGHGCPLQGGIDELLKYHKKTKHYSWYGFPQLYSKHTKSEIAKKFALNESDAINYIKHCSLRHNLNVMFTTILLILTSTNKTLNDILGNDDVKFISSVKLFYKICKTHNIQHTKKICKTLAKITNILCN